MVLCASLLNPLDKKKMRHAPHFQRSFYFLLISDCRPFHDQMRKLYCIRHGLKAKKRISVVTSTVSCCSKKNQNAPRPSEGRFRPLKKFPTFQTSMFHKRVRILQVLQLMDRFSLGGRRAYIAPSAILVYPRSVNTVGWVCSSIY